MYYWAASLEIRRQHGEPASFVIPSGNLGNATACVWARQLGAPIDEIVLAHNANRTVPDYFEQGVLRPRASVATLSSAMDVGNPSNLERLPALFPDPAAMRARCGRYRSTMKPRAGASASTSNASARCGARTLRSPPRPRRG